MVSQNTHNRRPAANPPLRKTGAPALANHSITELLNYKIPPDL